MAPVAATAHGDRSPRAPLKAPLLFPAALALAALLAGGAGCARGPATGESGSRPATGRPGTADTDLPRLFTVPDFTLVERSGRPATLTALRGRPFIADFIFTRCAGVCPAMTARMAALRTRLSGTPVRFVSFSVDPGNDTPEVLARYAAAAGADADWWFVTGPMRSLHALSTGGFKLAAMENAPGAFTADGPFLHSSKFVLVDSLGWIRGYYDSEDAAALRALEADARRLLSR